jgi:hypothetical protein
MNPRLVAFTGPLKGQAITLMAETSIGRGSSNQVARGPTTGFSLHKQPDIVDAAREFFDLQDAHATNGERHLDVAAVGRPQAAAFGPDESQ